ncbi:MAG: hypothetical protein ABI832_19085 [bacterium]
MRWLGALSLALAVAGCDLATTGARQVTVLQGEITIRAPEFYCVDPQSARGGDDTAVVLIGRCNATGHVAAALVTVTVGRFASAGVMLAGGETLRKFMSSTAGRRALSRSGRAADVQVLQSGVVDGRLILHLKDRVAGEYWRAILGVKGRLVTISANGSQDAPLTSDEGRALVGQTVEALLAANPATQR